ncbi:MAG TPA: hypothetical protein VGB37_08515 [Candidatus Lokiarchaeia archaeon]
MKRKICEYCRREIKGKGIMYVNVFQSNSHLFFCSRRCKTKWRVNVQMDKFSKIIEWFVRRDSRNYFFARKSIEIKGPNNSITYFSKDLNRTFVNIKKDNIFEKLEKKIQ